jgi:signal transduction histidine kinase
VPHILILLLLLFTYSFSNDEIVKIGVLAKRGAEVTYKKWNATAEYLTQEIAGKKFQIIPLGFDKVMSAANNTEVDFILANPGFYVELEYRYEAQRISTLVNKHLSGLTQKEFGGVLITHIDNKSKYNVIEDLVNTNFTAVDEKSLGGWQMAWRELAEHDIDVQSDLKSLTFKGTHDKVVYAVLNKEVDIGTVRTDTIERMAIEGKIDLNQLHFVALKDYENFPFLISTKLYPEWPMAKLKHTSDTLSKEVAIALMKLQNGNKALEKANISGWNTPLSYQPVHECFKVLKIPPYFQNIMLLDVLKKYWQWILFYFILAISGISMLIYQIRLTKNLKDTQEELVQTEKMASLGRLVAGIAHEINTPIGVGVTAASYLHKETKHFNEEYINENVTQNVFESFIKTSLQSSEMILGNLSRASDLIQSFKQISVDQTSDESRLFNLKDYVESIINSLKPTFKGTNHTIEVKGDKNILLELNAGIFSQIFSNMIMNSIIHGFENKDKGNITIIITQVNGSINIVYKDDGKGVSKENLSKLFDPFFTTKRDNGGSGLGTHIMYNLVTQKLYGKIKAESEVGKGLTFIINFKGGQNV